jgi:hypothetical protein
LSKKFYGAGVRDEKLFSHGNEEDMQTINEQKHGTAR